MAPTVLVNNGWYVQTRHPILLGVMVIILGTGALLGCVFPDRFSFSALEPDVPESECLHRRGLPGVVRALKDHGIPELYLDVAEALEVADGEHGQHLLKPFSRLSCKIGVFSCYRSNCSNSPPASGIPSKQKRSIRSSERDVHSSFWCCWYVRKTSFATLYVSP